ncbi:MAG: InlB B-repeat-containing protein, partial [Ruthenibacterium sp.]
AQPATTPAAQPEATPAAQPEATPAAQPEATPAAPSEAAPAAQPEATPAETPEAAPNAPMAASARTAAVPAQDNAKGANAGGFSKPTAETLDSHHLVIALYTGTELPSEPALQYGGYLYSNSQNILAGGGPNTDPQYGDSYSCGARCHSQKASDVLTSAVLDKLVSNGKRVGEAVWGYPNAVGVGECLTDSFKSGAETALLQNYLSQNPQMAKPIDSYEIVWYVAKYQSNDWHWHLDGIVKEKSAYTVQYLLNAPAGEVTGNMPNGAKDIMAGASYTVQAGDANFARTGHQFAGWSTKADGTGAPLYQPGDVIANIGANISLYAQWNMISNRVSFGTQGNGTLEGEVQMDVPYGSQLPSVPTP